MTYLLLFLSVAAGVVAVQLFQPQDRRKIKLLLSFAGAYIFAVTVLHLLPDVYGAGDEPATGSAPLSGYRIGLFILAGFFVQLLLEFFSHGIEHGHTHHDHDHAGTIPVGMMFGLCVHAFLEGMPLGVPSLDPAHIHARNILLVGIVMHNIPVSIVLFTMLLHNGLVRNQALFLMLIFALMSPFGMWCSGVAIHFSKYGHELMAVVIGIFLHISTTILFESSEEHRFNQRKMVAIAIGAAIALITSSL
jgi:zinc transporter ZupT